MGSNVSYHCESDVQVCIPPGAAFKQLLDCRTWYPIMCGPEDTEISVVPNGPVSSKPGFTWTTSKKITEMRSQTQGNYQTTWKEQVAVSGDITLVSAVEGQSLKFELTEMHGRTTESGSYTIEFVLSPTSLNNTKVNCIYDGLVFICCCWLPCKSYFLKKNDMIVRAQKLKGILNSTNSGASMY